MTRLHRFFIKEIENKKELNVTDQEVINQWKNVLRLKEGERVILFDGSGKDFLFSIQKISKNSAKLNLLEEKNNLPDLETDLYLIQSIIKRNNFELILEKVTEIGIKKITPIVSQRSVKPSLNLERSKKIIKEAAEQSGKTTLPEISEPSTISKVLEAKEEGRAYIVLDPKGREFSVKDFSYKKIGVFIGPEGGFSEDEIKIFQEKNIPIFSLGQQILRAETAAISFTSLMQLGR